MHHSDYKEQSKNKVVKNTYILLAMTLVFSGVMSYFGLQLETGFDNLFIWLVGAILLLLSLYPFKDSFLGIILVFAFTGWDGYWSGPWIRYYLELPQGEQIVMWSAFGTAFLFITLSLYAHITKKDFNYWGGFLYICLLGLIILPVLKLVYGLPISYLALAYFGVILFSAYILYDTSRIINGGEDSYISATVDLYLDILIIFFDLLRIIASWFKKSDFDLMD